MALCADRRDGLCLVLRRALRFVVAGLIMSLAGAAGLMRVLQTYLFGVTPTDPIVFTIVTLLLMALGLMAAWLPGPRGTDRPLSSAARGIAVNGTFGNETSNGARLVTACLRGGTGSSAIAAAPEIARHAPGATRV